MLYVVNLNDDSIKVVVIKREKERARNGPVRKYINQNEEETMESQKTMIPEARKETSKDER